VVLWREDVVVLEEDEVDASAVREAAVVEITEDVGDDVELKSELAEEEGGGEATALDDAGSVEETGCGVGDCMFAADEDGGTEETGRESDTKALLKARFAFPLFPLIPPFPFPLFPLIDSLA
jgi:hypothetical protein